MFTFINPNANIICIILLIIVIAPIAKSPPNLESWLFKLTKTKLSVLCIIKGAIPNAKTGFIVFISIFKYFFLTILILGLLISVVGIGYVVAVIKTTPSLDVNAIYNLNQPSMLYDDQGNFIDDLPSTEIRYIISYDEMPQNLINAYISIEDERFMTHGGIDIKRILGAAARDVMVILGKQNGIHGASTITQQLIKNTILSSEAASESNPLDRINRKIKEIVLAVKLDKQVSKEEIIRTYLNTIPLSGHIYGVEAASRYFFAKNAKDLTLLECAYIAGITQAPTTYSAYNTSSSNYPNGYINRTKTVLSKMLEL